MIVYGVVVLYNPNIEVFSNINSYITDIEKLYIIDNTERKDLKFVEKVKDISHKCVYIDNKGNKGIAYALNLAAKFSISENANWLLTMDQDSKFFSSSVQIMRNWIDINDTTNIGIVSPSHMVNEEKKYKFYNLLTMTSGNLVNLSIYQKLGGFLEKFFIDCVDTEYCLRLKRYGFKIHRISTIVLEHHLGNVKKHSFLGFSFHPSNHIPVRRYYITRNRLWLWQEYKNDFPDFIAFEKKMTLYEIIKILLGEEEKCKKIIAILDGYRDYKKGIFGKYE